MCPKQSYMSKFRALKVANICQKEVKTTSKIFLISDVLCTNINYLQIENFTRNVFLGTPNTLPKLSHIQSNVM